ncbi:MULTISPECIES: putative Ig domain-containing protein [unclassified Lentimonas]|uniref:putative Ig domain-containing protein n=1 Tax=unclassified Lentimonas TaxID=2630993 RepID=UPI00132B5ABC|nr:MULTISPECIES: putative Ig domain-containing protein [unclassified Lentimonas]CAA6679652.1 Unannotated [Lentimonas sp. CC4]CAA6683581.1 Unannotated [Lentimonas sp. CC6]CAA7077343.1 Unannotated [Lentimonas sp. CC4]CAA7170140.1 Unannotated [Lentimonas sp. CC21]CAA7182471.1 Unannotated [Lentimonas sp. CC8]
MNAPCFSRTLIAAVSLLLQSPAVAAIYSGATDDATYAQLLADLEVKATALTAKVTEAESAGMNTDYAQVSQVTIDWFKDFYIPWDKANLTIVDSTYVHESKAASLDPVYSTYGAIGLVFDEIVDCIELADLTINELDQQIAGTIVLQAPPDFSVGTMVMNGSHYELDGQRVIPGKYFWQPEDEATLQAFGRMGGTYYGIQPSMDSATTVVEGQVNGITNSMASQRLNNQAPVEVFLGHVMNNQSYWSRVDHPEVFSSGGRVFTHYDIDNPLTRSWLTVLFDDLLEPTMGPSGAGDVPRVHLLTNEPRFPIRYGDGDARNNVSSFTYAKFATWLEAQYTTLANLNAVYGENYASFAEASTANYTESYLDTVSKPVQYPDGFRTPGGVNSNLRGGPIWYDWCRFNMDRVNDWFTFLKNGVQSADPGAPTNIKIWGEQGIHASGHDRGIDFEFVTKLVDYPGSDSQATSLRTEYDTRDAQDWRDHYILEWRAQAIMMDFMKSICPEKPYIDLEWHGLSGSRWRDFHMEPEFVRATLWLGATHGLTALNAWLWNRNDDGSIRRPTEEFIGTAGAEPLQMAAFGRTLKEINAHGNAVTSLTPNERYYMVYYSQDSAIQDGDYSDGMADVYESLKLLNVPVGFTTPSELPNVTAEQTVIVPPTPYLSDTDLAGLQAFVAGGGSVVLVDSSNAFDYTERGASRADGAGFVPFASVNYGGVFAMADALSTALESRKPSLPLEVDVRDASLNPAYGVLASRSYDAVTSKSTVSLINVSQQQRTVLLRVSGYSVDYVNLLTGQHGTGTYVLEPNDVLLLRTENLVPAGQSVWFTSDPISETNAAQGLDYSGSSLLDNANDLNGNSLSFSKLVGPKWLSVAPNGALSGKPSSVDFGENEFTVQVEDTSGGSDTATLQITVETGPAELLNDDFESGFGNWESGGDDAILSSLYAIGNQCVEISDDSGVGSSITLINSLDLSSASELKIEFTYMPIQMNVGEDFWLQFSSDDGSKWSTVKTYVRDTDFTVDQREDETLTIESSSYPFTSTVKIRFRCDASANSDYIYLDNIVMTANSGTYSSWERHVAQHGLAGTPEADEDTDGEADFYEFALGGDVVDSSVLAPVPAVTTGSTTASFSYLERNQANAGVSYTARWTDDLVDGPWSDVWDTVSRNSVSDPDYVEVEHRLSNENRDRLFFKVEVTQP